MDDYHTHWSQRLNEIEKGDRLFKMEHTPKDADGVLWVVWLRCHRLRLHYTWYVEMMWNLAVKQSRLPKQTAPFLLPSKTRPHSAKVAVAKLQKFELKTPRHLPYSLNFVPTDHHLFRKWDNFSVEKKSNSAQPVKTGFRSSSTLMSQASMSKG